MPHLLTRCVFSRLPVQWLWACGDGGARAPPRPPLHPRRQHKHRSAFAATTGAAAARPGTADEATAVRRSLHPALLLRVHHPVPPRRRPRRAAGGGVSRRGKHGLDLAVVATFPIVPYREIKEHKIGSGALECAVCLTEFEDDDDMRLLPHCSHAFHPECIDPWLESRTTCPLCRANLEKPPPPLTPEEGAQWEKEEAASVVTPEEPAASAVAGAPGQDDAVGDAEGAGQLPEG
ncbi:hypothetical protein CFC21_039454 [Triticum aestivum]|uniref:RING-type E3 ubiquitin transferase n=2 Tax=Triticum aestivum TaxID=4565 RepID=A0A9R1FEN6_WHEAT|nr:hypothetical protein CFC21_039454 [Triticum aestivum]